jgi:hypothetical protein
LPAWTFSGRRRRRPAGVHTGGRGGAAGHEQDRGRAGPIRHGAGRATAGMRGRRRQQGLEALPQLVGQQAVGQGSHGRDHRTTRPSAYLTRGLCTQRVPPATLYSVGDDSGAWPARQEPAQLVGVPSPRTAGRTALLKICELHPSSLGRSSGAVRSTGRVGAASALPPNGPPARLPAYAACAWAPANAAANTSAMIR